MKRERSRGGRIVLLLSFLAVTVIFSGLLAGPSSQDQKGSSALGIGNERTLKAAYERWEPLYTQNGGEQKLIIPLTCSKGLSSRITTAAGLAMIDLTNGNLVVQASGLGEGESFDFWLIDNKPGPGHSVKPETGDVMVRMGTLTIENGKARLQAHLDLPSFQGFQIDMAAVTGNGLNPGEGGGILFGSPSLFQKIYYARRGQTFTAESGEETADSGWAKPFQFMIPQPAYASVFPRTDFGSLLRQGERLFFEEAFNGNGRTCGTCHPVENNLTIDPMFIATLPPTDPLFVAETNPALRENFEKPKLMRELGLILENLDGFDDLDNKFVMRGVPHILGLSATITPPPNGEDGTTIPPVNRVGWSGDGAPGSGSLREFPIGAITQHYPKTLNREIGVDFRLPTDFELDALEAFLLSVGRDQDVDLSTLRLKGVIPAKGLEIFTREDTGPGTPAQGALKCNTCHFNAGATLSDRALALKGFPAGRFNFNFDIGSEFEQDEPADLIDPANNPIDGGFGREPYPTLDGVFGDGSFNVPSLVEAADTPPFFHNNMAPTLELTIQFYLGKAFTSSPGASFLAELDSNNINVLAVSSTQTAAIAAFLRVLNALDNIRSAIDYEERLLNEAGVVSVDRLFLGAVAENMDAIEMLEASQVHMDAIQKLRRADASLNMAKWMKRMPFFRKKLLREAILSQKEARSLMVDE